MDRFNSRLDIPKERAMNWKVTQKKISRMEQETKDGKHKSKKKQSRMRMANIHLMIVMTGVKKEGVTEAIFEATVSEIFPELIKNTISTYSRGPISSSIRKRNPHLL